MKLITAYIQPERLNIVKQELYENKIYKMSVTNVLGCGQQRGYNQRFRGVVTEVNLLKKICLKIAVNDEFVQPCIDAIIKGARTGAIGDGKIFVTELEQCIRIRTGETGPEAIGSSKQINTRNLNNERSSNSRTCQRRHLYDRKHLDHD